MSKKPVSTLVKLLNNFTEPTGKMYELVAEIAGHQNTDSLYRQIFVMTENALAIPWFLETYFDMRSEVYLTDKEGRDVSARLFFIPTIITTEPNNQKKSIKVSGIANEDVVSFFRKNKMLALSSDSILVLPGLYEVNDLLDPRFYTLLEQAIMMQALPIELHRLSEIKAHKEGVFVNQRFVVGVTIRYLSNERHAENNIKRIDKDNDHFIFFSDTGLKLPSFDFSDKFSPVLRSAIESGSTKKTNVIVDCYLPSTPVEALIITSDLSNMVLVEGFLDDKLKDAKNPMFLLSMHYVDSELKIRIEAFDDDKKLGYIKVPVYLFKSINEAKEMVFDMIDNFCFRYSEYHIGFVENVMETDEIEENTPVEFVKFTETNSKRTLH